MAQDASDTRAACRPTEAAYVPLPSKVHVPGRVGDAIARDAVFAKLDCSLSCRVTSVVAPAGYGKTTAVALWAERLRPAGAVPAQEEPTLGWYTLSPQDASVGVFWRYVCAALCAADPSLEPGLSELRFSEDSASLVNAVGCVILAVGALARPVVLVLDDFHAVQDEEPLVESVQYLVNNLPQNLHLVVTSRRPLPLSLARLRVAGQLTCVDEDDLRFSCEEEAGFFARASAPVVSPSACSAETLARIDACTHGWPAGCRLVAMLGGPGEPDLDEARASMGDYLFEEVFLSLSPEQRDFLVKTSVVESFCPSLAAALTGLPASRALDLAEGLASGDLFVVRIEHVGAESWYRYHLLLSDMLRARAAGLDAHALAASRLAARDWYTRNGYLDQAVDMCVAACDWDGLRDVIVANWKTLYMDDSHQTLVRWASRMPWPRVLESPFLCAVLAMPYALCGKADLANALVKGAVCRLKPGEDFLFALCMVQKAFLASFTARFADMRAFAEKALHYLPEEEYYLRGMMFQVLASSYSATDPVRSRELFHEALRVQEPFGNKNLTCSALGNLALCCANLGLFDEAALHARAAFALYEPAQRAYKPMLAHAYLVQAHVAYQAGQADEALENLDAYSRLASQQDASPEICAQAWTLRAKALALKGGPVPATEEVVVRAFGASVTGVAETFPGVALVKSCASAVRGQVQACLAAGEGHCGALRVLASQVAWCLGEAVPALCEDVCAFADGVDEQEHLLCVNAQVAAVLLCEQAALSRRAEAHLARAAALAARFALPMPLRENAPGLRAVAQRVMAASHDAGVLACLSQLFQAPGPTGGQPDAALTERELDVMRLVAAGMSVAQAADHLVVSRETVKKHLANIYAKLGVHSKMQAVALLRERGEL